MTKRISLISAFAMLAASAAPLLVSAEDIKAVVHDARGNPVKDARDNCVRTEWETPNDECGGHVITEQRHERLASVYFEFNKSTLTPKAQQTLNELLSTLRNKHIEAVTIAGYADAVGSSSYNKRLSEKRARAVQHYLRMHGFQHADTDVRALGKSETRTTAECQGLKDGKLHACMQEDRRVDIEVGVVTRQVR